MSGGRDQDRRSGARRAESVRAFEQGEQGEQGVSRTLKGEGGTEKEGAIKRQTDKQINEQMGGQTFRRTGR